MAHILLVGNSHLVALLHAAREAAGQAHAPAETSFLWESDEIRVERVSIDRPSGAAHLGFALLDGASWLRFAEGPADHPSVSQTYAEPLRALADGGVDQVVSCLYGNEHSVFSMLEHDVPFDFELDGLGVEDTGGSRQIVPREVVQRELAHRLEPLIRSCLALQRLFPDAPLSHVLPPPPVADSDLIQQRPEALAAVIDARGVAPGPIRLKTYRLAEQIVTDALSGSGVRVVPAPPGAFRHGYLAEECWMASVHANVSYGALVLDQLGAR